MIISLLINNLVELIICGLVIAKKFNNNIIEKR